MAKKSTKRKVRRVALNIIMICLSIIMLLSGWKVYTSIRDYKANRDIYNRIAELAQPNGYTLDIDFDALHKINKDIIAWIYYESTNINYPIVKGRDNDQYLHVTVEGTWSVGGSLFVDAITSQPFNQFNTIVYGHHMQDGTMFGNIKKLKDPEYAKEHPEFELATLDGKYRLRICAFLNQPSDSDIYTTNFYEDDLQGKQQYIDLIKSHASYLTSETMDVNDRLVILSTCAYEYKEARYMVVCKMLPWE